MEQQSKQPVQRGQMAELSLFEFSKSLNIRDSIFDSPNREEISNLLNNLSRCSKKEVKPALTLGNLEKPKTSHLDPDEEQALESNQADMLSCKRKKVLQIQPRSSKVLKRSNSFATLAVKTSGELVCHNFCLSK
jgi:hypothetical protein